jgi:alcohol dehydrogenase
MAQKAAWLRGAKRVIAVDPLDYRLNKAKEVNKVETLNAHDEHLMEKLREMTNGRGPDVAIDAVGTEAERSFLEKAKAVWNAEKGTMKVIDWCTQAVRRGGIVSVVGVYGSPYDNFPIHRIFDKGLIMKFGQAPVQKYIDHLFEIVRDGKVVLDDIITHKIPLSDATRGYDMFKNKVDDCVKVVLKP